MSLIDWIYVIPMVACSLCMFVGAIFIPELRSQLRRQFFCFPPHLPQASGPRLWVHAASVGEMALGVRLAVFLQAQQPNLEVVFTTNKDTALEIAQAQGFVAYLRPFDFSFFVRLLLKRLKPDALVLIEAELWPNLIHQAAKKVPVVMVNGRLSDEHARSYQRFRFIYGPMIRRFTAIFASDSDSSDRFKALGAEVTGQGNLKLGLTPKPKEAIAEQLKTQCGIQPTDFVLVAGSVQPEELALLAPSFRRLQAEQPGFRAIIVPRHPEKRGAFIEAAKKAGLSIELSTEGNWSCSDLYLVDQIGVLTPLYSLAQLAFVGGSFTDRGGQNMVEPVGLGTPTAVGPYTRNFNEPVKLLSEAGGLEVLQNPEDLANLALNTDRLTELSQNGLFCLEQQQNHWKQVLEVLDEILNHHH